MEQKEGRVKKKSYDVALLLTILMLFSASLGVLHGRKKKQLSPLDINDDVAQIILTKQDALDYLDPLLLTGNVDTAARILHQFSDAVFFEVLEAILDDQFKGLSNEQKIQLLLAAIKHDENRTKQTMLIAKLANKFAEYSVFYDAADFYGDTIPVIQSWIKSTESDDLNKVWLQKSLEKAIHTGDVERLDSLYSYNVRPTKEQASDLLRSAVLESKQDTFVPFFVNQLGADVNYSSDGKRTILIEAVEADNPDMVRALLQAGADANLILDPAVGSAKQIAFEKGYTAVDAVIREHH